MNDFNIVTQGVLGAGFAREGVLAALAQLFNQPEARVLNLLSGQRVVIKRGLDAPTAETYVQRLRETGLVCVAEPAALDIEPDALNLGSEAPDEPPPRHRQFAPEPPPLSPRSAAKVPPLPSAAGRADGIPDALWNAVAQKRIDYYVPRWKRYAAGERTFPSWHWPALFLNAWWALYRRSWAGALVFMVGWPVVFYGGVLIAVALGTVLNSDMAAGLLMVTAYLATWVLPPTLANGFYYRKARKLIAKAQSLSPELDAQVAYLTKKGGAGALAPVLWLVGTVVVTGILAAITIPQYAEYKARAQVAGALAAVEPLKSQLVAGVKATGYIPDLDFAAVKSSPEAKGLRDVQLDDDNRLVLTFNFEPMVGRQLALRPYRKDGDIAWSCETIDAPNHLVPVYCRGN